MGVLIYIYAYIYIYTHIHTYIHTCMGFPGGTSGKEPTCSIPGLQRSPGGVHGNSLQYSHLEVPMDRGAWRLSIGLQRVRNDWSTSACMHVCTTKLKGIYHNTSGDYSWMGEIAIYFTSYLMVLKYLLNIILWINSLLW